MTTILTRLAFCTVLLLVATFSIGWLSWSVGASRLEGSTYPIHFYLGLATVLVCLAVHCLIFIYFLGTGRWVKEVAIAYSIPDEPLPKLTRELKRKAFPPALFAMLVPIFTAAAGAGAYRGEWHWAVHATTAIGTLLINLWAFRVELACVRANVAVLEDVMHEVDRIRAAAGLPTNEEALRQEAQQ